MRQIHKALFSLPPFSVVLQFKHIIHHSSANDLSLEEIPPSSQTNNASAYAQRLRTSLNDAAQDSQSLTPEKKYVQYSERFHNVPNAVHSQMLYEFNHEIDIPDKEE